MKCAETREEGAETREKIADVIKYSITAIRFLAI